jgi:hypothetical protein
VKVNTDLLDANTGLLQAIRDEVSVLAQRIPPAS